MVFVASLFVLASPQILPDVYRPFPTYRPAFLPQALAEATCEGARIDGGSIRGKRPIKTRWILKRPFAEVARALRQETALNPAAPSRDDERYVTTHRRLPDRIVEVYLRSGHEEAYHGMRSSGVRQVDHEDYVTAILTERPLYTGPLPRRWPSSASGPSLPSSFPGVPIAGLPRTPDLLTRWISPGGSVRYAMSWFIREAAGSSLPRMSRLLLDSGKWRIVPGAGDPIEVRFAPASQPSLFGEVVLFRPSLPPPELHGACTRVDVMWSDLPDL